MRKQIFWMPLLFVGSMFYWTMAVSLGGISLGAFWPCHEQAEMDGGIGGGDVYQPIRVTFRRAPVTAWDTAGPQKVAGTSQPREIPSPPTSGPPQGPGETAF